MISGVKLMSDELSQRVFAILNKHAKTRPGEISGNTVLEEIGLESIEIVECVFDLEEAFDITIPNPGENAAIDTRFTTAAEVVVAVRQLVEQALTT
jgi:acyl carrier protein